MILLSLSYEVHRNGTESTAPGQQHVVVRTGRGGFWRQESSDSCITHPSQSSPFLPSLPLNSQELDGVPFHPLLPTSTSGAGFPHRCAQHVLLRNRPY